MARFVDSKLADLVLAMVSVILWALFFCSNQCWHRTQHGIKRSRQSAEALSARKEKDKEELERYLALEKDVLERASLPLLSRFLTDADTSNRKTKVTGAMMRSIWRPPFSNKILNFTLYGITEGTSSWMACFCQGTQSAARTKLFFWAYWHSVSPAKFSISWKMSLIWRPINFALTQRSIGSGITEYGVWRRPPLPRQR